MTIIDRALAPRAQSAGKEQSLIRRNRLADRMPAPHRHSSVEFNLVIEGTATYLLDDRRYELRPNTLVWLFPAQVHVLTNKSAAYRDWLGLFSQTTLRLLCSSPASADLLETNPDGHYARRLSAAAAARLEGLFEQVALSENPDAVDAGLAYAALAAWDAFTSADDVAISAPVHPAVGQAARIMQTDVGNTMTIADISRQVALSPNHLSRLFHEQMGVPVTRFRNEHRFRRFLDVIGTGENGTVTDAAMAAGFGSYAQFFRVFRQLTGATPSEYLGIRTAQV